MISHKDFAIHLALQAGQVLKQRFQPGGTPATLKTDHSFVTQVDLEVDQLVSRAMHESLPEEHLLSEESHHGVDNLEPALWIVDPLDGTTNYSLGLQVWGISIARLVHGHPVLGVLYFPLLDELYVAEQGLGAIWNGITIHTQPPNRQRPMSFFACCSRTHRRYFISVPYKPRILGSAAYSFCLLARGAACVAFEAAPKIWDIAAAWLLVSEAGGTIAPFNSELPFPVAINKDYSAMDFPTLAAASQNLYLKVYSQIQLKSPKQFYLIKK